MNSAPGQRMVDLYDDFYGDKPLFLADMLTQELRYNALMDQLDELEDAAALQGIAHVPARVKCAVLAWHTLEEALDGEGKVK